jgi:hypothetical protein
MIAKIQIEFPKLRPDLRHSTEELKEERLIFCQHALGLREPPSSLRNLSDKQLGRVIEAISKERSEPRLPGCEIHGTKASVRSNSNVRCKAKDMMQLEGAEIFHLASGEQVWVVNRIFEYLGWTPEGQARFIESKFGRRSPTLLRPRQAQSLTFILLRIAASNDLKKKPGVVRVSDAMIGSYIHDLKKKLGIDQGGQQ